MKILVLGHKGMLGNCVYSYLSQYHETVTIDCRFPNPDFVTFLIKFKGMIVNCIGSIPQKKNDDFHINYQLPIFLCSLSNPIIHPGTDCEDDNTFYGQSKKIASDWIKTKTNTKILKASVIGRELNSTNGLLEWFLNNEEVQGYTCAMWNGITTLEWSKYCHDIIDHWDKYNKETILTSDCISKYDLLKIIAKVFNKKIVITPLEKGENKCLKGIYTKPIKQQLEELRSFYE